MFKLPSRPHFLYLQLALGPPPHGLYHLLSAPVPPRLRLVFRTGHVWSSARITPYVSLRTEDSPSPLPSAGIWCPLRAPYPSSMFMFGSARASPYFPQTALPYQDPRPSYSSCSVSLWIVMNDFGGRASRLRSSYSSGIARRYG